MQLPGAGETEWHLRHWATEGWMVGMLEVPTWVTALASGDGLSQISGWLARQEEAAGPVWGAGRARYERYWRPRQQALIRAMPSHMPQQ